LQTFYNSTTAKSIKSIYHTISPGKKTLFWEREGNIDEVGYSSANEDKFMPQEEEIFAGLEKLGLSQYEIKIYRSLVINGPLTSTEAAKISGVPQPRVYDVFQTLTDKGYIEGSMAQKRTYRALPVETVLDRNIESLQVFKKEISDFVKARKVSGKSAIPALWLMNKKQYINESVKSMINGAKTEILISVTNPTFRYVKKYLIEAARRGITIGLVVYPDTDDESLESLRTEMIIRRRPGSASEVLIVDRSTGVLNVDGIGIDNHYALYFGEDEMIHVLSYYYYHTIWLPGEYVADFESRKKWVFSSAWFACEAINSINKIEHSFRGEVKGMLRDKEVVLKGEIPAAEIVMGLRHTFFINSRGRTYSVGGKTARLEDVRMSELILEIDTKRVQKRKKVKNKQSASPSALKKVAQKTNS
jgi:sugar-specific transcriptional regulator TrmB